MIALWLTTGMILLTMLLAVVRACLGPTPYDRTLATSSFATVTMLLIALSGFVTGRPEFLDLALIYGLLAFLGVLALLRFVRHGSFAARERRDR